MGEKSKGQLMKALQGPPGEFGLHSRTIGSYSMQNFKQRSDKTRFAIYGALEFKGHHGLGNTLASDGCALGNLQLWKFRAGGL